MPSVDPSSGNWLAPDTVTFFVQPPGVGFLAFLMTLAPVPLPDRVRLDLALTEDFRRSWSIARNPLQRVTAQNRIKNPDELSLTGMLSAHPLNPILGNLGAARLDKRELHKLKQIFESELHFIVTPERPHNNMSCVDYTEHYDDETGKGVFLTLRFEEMQIAIPSAITPELDLEALLIGGGSTSQAGAQAPADVPDPGGLG